jgi:hypothetical protein
MTSSLDAPGASAIVTSLKPPSMSKAAASAFSSIQKIPYRCSSGTSSPGLML